MAHHAALEFSAAIEQTEPRITQPAERAIIISEQAMEPFHRPHRHGVVATTAPLVLPQDAWLREIPSGLARVTDHFNKRGHIKKSEIGALSCKGMHDMCGVTDQH